MYGFGGDCGSTVGVGTQPQALLGLQEWLQGWAISPDTSRLEVEYKNDTHTYFNPWREFFSDAPLAEPSRVTDESPHMV